MATKQMSLRKIAKELGVSHTLLVLWRQGKRRLSPELEARFHELVTKNVAAGYKSGDKLRNEVGITLPVQQPLLRRTVLVEQGGQ